MSSRPRISADGLFYWDGSRWVSALSPDGRFRWNGAGWVPLAPAARAPVYAPLPAYVPAQAQPSRRPQRVPTTSTSLLQYAVAGLFGLSVIAAVGSPFLTLGALDDRARRIALQQAGQAPDLYPDPQQYASSVITLVNFGVVIGVAVLVALAAVLLVGALRRWTWTYYAVLAWLAIMVMALPSSFMHAVGLGRASPTTQAEQIAAWFGLAYGVLGTALGVWMLAVQLRVGAWATRKPMATG